jgi:hypothetical protein
MDSLFGLFAASFTNRRKGTAEMSSITQVRAPAAPETASTTSHVAAAPPEPVSWRNCAVVDDWRSFVIPIALAVILLVAIGLSTEKVWNVVFAAAVLLVVSWRVWLPTRYEASSRGIVQSYLGRARRLNWSAVARVQILPRGIRLLGDVEPSPLDPWTGLYVPCGEHRDEVAMLASQHVELVEPLG